MCMHMHMHMDVCMCMSMSMSMSMWAYKLHMLHANRTCCMCMRACTRSCDEREAGRRAETAAELDQRWLGDQP